MKRTNIEFMIGWLDALRRDDVEALKATLEPDRDKALIAAGLAAA